MRTLFIRYWTPFALSLLLLGAAWVAVSAAAPGSTDPGGIPAPRPGFLAPGFSLQTLYGEQLTLADLRGRPVIINIWASWCAPCKAEMPALQKVYSEYTERGLEILAVNATNQDNLSDVAAFATAYGLTFPILLDEKGEVAQLYQLAALPTTFFVGADGVIDDLVIGGPISEALLRIRIEQMIEEVP